VGNNDKRIAAAARMLGYLFLHMDKGWQGVAVSGARTRIGSNADLYDALLGALAARYPGGWSLRQYAGGQVGVRVQNPVWWSDEFYADTKLDAVLKLVEAVFDKS